MIYGSWWVNTVCFLAICAAVLLSPVWGIWLCGGMVADNLERRSLKLLKGD